MTDAYQTLGVARNATDEEIKRAYRKLAGKHHPDKGGDTAKFQEIQTAYETLTDPQKRHQHDNPNPFGGHNSDHFEFHFGGGNPHDIFSQFFQQGGNPFQQRQARRNKDLRISLTITLDSTLSAQTKTVSVQTTKGDRFNVDVNIPKGVSNGTTIKYGQLGDNMFETLTRGDLYVIINILPHEKFEVRGVNLVMPLEVDAIDAMLGIEQSVQVLDGREFLVKVPQGCQHGSKFGIQGQGLYQMNSEYRGDLIIDIRIKIPTLSEAQLTVLRNIKSSS